MEQLHPRAIWLFFISSLLRWIFVFLFLGIWIIGAISDLNQNIGNNEFGIIGYAGWFIIIFIVLVALLYAWSKLSYNFYRYELKEDGFRKELGVITKKYVTIPYDRIQNVDIYRGVLARILGLSDLSIQTAGSSMPMAGGGFSGGSEGSLPGLSKEVAEQLRDELVRRAKQSKNQGL